MVCLLLPCKVQFVFNPDPALYGMQAQFNPVRVLNCVCSVFTTKCRVPLMSRVWCWCMECIKGQSNKKTFGEEANSLEEKAELEKQLHKLCTSW